MTTQEQQIRAGIRWMRTSNTEEVKRFFDTVQDAKPEQVRAMSEDYLEIMRRFACIGMYVVAERSVKGRAGGEG